MSELPPSNTPGENYPQPAAYQSPGQGDPGMPTRPPVSRQAVSGFVLACISLFYFGFLGVIGAGLCLRGLRDVRRGHARGRWLAIAGAAIGLLSSIFYVVSLFLPNS